MVKCPLRVYVRTRPTADFSPSINIGSERNIAVVVRKGEEGSQSFGSSSAGQTSTFSNRFDGVLHNATQEDVFTSAALDVVSGVIDGYNGTIFAYGQTGAGKTYTMTGDTASYSERGIVPRSIHELFRAADERIEYSTVMRVSFLEIYNEVMYDLLAEHPESSESLVIVDEGGSTAVRGLTRRVVANEEEALAMFFSGENVRSTADHSLNHNSSRSHCIFTIEMESTRLGDAAERVTVSKLHLVDLAGSERTKKTQVTGQTLKEANFINKSLSFLEQTVSALGKKEAHVPFRQTKLTSALKDALGGNSRSVMIACAWPEDRHQEETISTLRFASRVRLLQTEPTINERADPAMLVRRYKRQIDDLKRELAMRDSLSGKSRVVYDEYSPSEKAELEANLRLFLSGQADVESVAIDSLYQVKETYLAFKRLYTAAASSSATAIGPQGGDAVREDEALAAGTKGVDDAGSAAVVGDVDETISTGFHVGTAPASLRPAELSTPGGPREDPMFSPGNPGGRNLQTPIHSADDGKGDGGDLSLGTPRHAPGLGLDDSQKPAAFEMYKDGVGRELSEAMRTVQNAVRDSKTEIKVLGDKTNMVKREIDQYSALLKDKRSNGASGDDVVDAEEYSVLRSLKEAKLKYRENFEELRKLREKLEENMMEVATTRKRLLDSFEVWYASDEKGVSFNVGGEVDNDDLLDAAEQFDKMELDRIMAADPESSAFHAARKTVRRARASKADKDRHMRLDMHRSIGRTA